MIGLKIRNLMRPGHQRYDSPIAPEGRAECTQALGVVSRRTKAMELGYGIQVVASTLFLSFFVVGCKNLPYASVSPEGPTLGTAKDWAAELEQDDGRPTAQEIGAFQQETRALCGDALSEGALAMTPNFRGCIFVVSPKTEIEALLGLLRETPRDHPDWIRIVDRLATNGFDWERTTFRNCIELGLASPTNRKRLRSLEQYRDELRRSFQSARRVSREACELLARSDQKDVHAPCPYRAPKKQNAQALVCAETIGVEMPPVPRSSCESGANGL